MCERRFVSWFKVVKWGASSSYECEMSAWSRCSECETGAWRYGELKGTDVGCRCVLCVRVRCWCVRVQCWCVHVGESVGDVRENKVHVRRVLCCDERKRSVCMGDQRVMHVNESVHAWWEKESGWCERE